MREFILALGSALIVTGIVFFVEWASKTAVSKVGYTPRDEQAYILEDETGTGMLNFETTPMVVGGSDQVLIHNGSVPVWSSIEKGSSTWQR